MDKLLQTDFIAYLNNLKPTIIQCIPIQLKDIKSDVIDDVKFDIKDLEPTIKQAIGTGSATYNNPQEKVIAFIDYERFLKLQPHQPNCSNAEDVIKRLNLKQPDFIAYDLEEETFFLLNELSLSSSSRNKLNDARQQLHNAVMHLNGCIKTREFIDRFIEKVCIFSNKTKLVETPENIADAFDLIKSYLPEPIEHKYQPITKLGFKFVETAIVDV